MISGSFVASLLFADALDYSDFDLYFSSKKDLNHAVKLLKESNQFELHYKSNHALTYTHVKTKDKVQIIKKLHKTPHHLVYAHDFHNCGAAYYSKQRAFYVSQEAIKAWANNQLVLNKTPLDSNRLPKLHFFQTITILFKRIEKYSSRYNIALDERSTSRLSNYKQKCIRLLGTYSQPSDILEPVDYAGSVYSFAEFVYNEIYMHELRRV